MEEWRQVKGYEGYYEVSNLGRVKRTGNKVKRGNHILTVPIRIMKPLDNGKGYLRVKLTMKNKSRRVMLHRIIADAFIPNPESKPNINHINHDRKDNRIENLEWCTQSENVIHAVKAGRWTQGGHNKKRK